jgi:hypothetical protein
MRLHRVRVRPRQKIVATKSLEGRKWFRNSKAGRAAKEEAKWEQYRAQASTCGKCGRSARLDELKFEKKEFVEGEVNRLVHKSERVCE